MDTASGLPEDFPVHLISKMVAAIRRAYDVNFEHYDPAGAGHNGWTFGVQVHRSLCCFIKDEVEQEPGVMIKMIWNSVEIQASGFVLRPQKLHGVEQGVWEALPNNLHTAEAMARENEKATPTLPGTDWREPTHFVIGHGGTPEDGCTTIHLCAPAKGWDEALGWELAVQVFNASAEEASSAEAGQALAPVEEIPDPLVETLDEGDQEEGGA